MDAFFRSHLRSILKLFSLRWLARWRVCYEMERCHGEAMGRSVSDKTITIIYIYIYNYIYMHIIWLIHIYIHVYIYIYMYFFFDTVLVFFSCIRYDVLLSRCMNPLRHVFRTMNGWPKLLMQHATLIRHIQPWWKHCMDFFEHKLPHVDNSNTPWSYNTITTKPCWMWNNTTMLVT